MSKYEGKVKNQECPYNLILPLYSKVVCSDTKLRWEQIVLKSEEPEPRRGE